MSSFRKEYSLASAIFTIETMAKEKLLHDEASPSRIGFFSQKGSAVHKEEVASQEMTPTTSSHKVD